MKQEKERHGVQEKREPIEKRNEGKFYNKQLSTKARDVLGQGGQFHP